MKTTRSVLGLLISSTVMLSFMTACETTNTSPMETRIITSQIVNTATATLKNTPSPASTSTQTPKITATPTYVPTLEELVVPTEVIKSGGIDYYLTKESLKNSNPSLTDNGYILETVATELNWEVNKVSLTDSNESTLRYAVAYNVEKTTFVVCVGPTKLTSQNLTSYTCFVRPKQINTETADNTVGTIFTVISFDISSPDLNDPKVWESGQISFFYTDLKVAQNYWGIAGPQASQAYGVAFPKILKLLGAKFVTVLTIYPLTQEELTKLEQINNK